MLDSLTKQEPRHQSSIREVTGDGAPSNNGGGCGSVLCVVCSGKAQSKPHLGRGPGLGINARGCVYAVDSSFMLIQRRIHGHEPHHC